MKCKILSLILAAAMLLNSGATSVFAMDGSASPVQDSGTTIDASGDVDPACICGAGEGETHAGDCPQYIAPAEPEQPADPACTCEAKCAGDAINAECEVCSAEGADLAACEGEIAARPAVTGVRELIAALPDAEALAEMSVEEQNQVYDALLAADEAYQALNEEQKGQLAEENAKLDALFAYFNSPNMIVPAAETPTVEYRNIYANGTPITIEAGTTTGYTKIWYGNENAPTYLDVDPLKDGEQHEADLSSYTIYGGSKDGAVESASITMTGGKVEFIYGGGNGGSVTDDTEVLINGGEVGASVFGGGNQSSVGGKASVTVTGGKVGFEYSGHAVYGGGAGGAVDSTEVTITGGEATAVYGGGDDGSSVTNNTKVTITGGTVESIYGSGNYGGAGSTDVLIDTNSTVNEVYGGGVGSGSSVTGNTKVTIKGTVRYSVYGGGAGVGVGSTEVLIDAGGTVGSSDYGGDVYGGSSTYNYISGTVTGNTDVTIKGTVIGNVYGGGGGSGANVGGSTNVLIETGGKVSGGDVYGGYRSNVAGKASVTIKGTVTEMWWDGMYSSGGNVYGGCYNGSVGSTDVLIDAGGTVKNAYGGGYGGTVNGDTEITVSGGTADNIYGGSVNGTVAGNTNISISGGNVRANINGGDAGNGTVAGDTDINISGGTVGGSVGSISGGDTVSGSSTLTITGGSVYARADDSSGGIISADEITLGGSAHVKCENGIQGDITFGDGFSRTASDGDFQRAAASGTTSEGYFEYLSVGHVDITADADGHTFTCNTINGSGCTLHLSETQSHTTITSAGGQVCTTCGYTRYNIWVGGVQVGGVPDANGNITVTGDTITGTVTITPAGDTVDNPGTSALENAPTLTLDGASITAAETPVDVDYDYNPLRGIYSGSALNLVLTGANTITADTTSDSVGVMADAEDLAINGGGSLKIDGCGHGIKALSLVTDGVTVEIIDSIYAISLNVDGTITDSTVSAVGSIEGISTTNGMIKIDNSSVYAKGGTYSFSGFMDGVSVSLSGDTHVKAEGAIDTDIGVNSDGSGYLRGVSDYSFEYKEAGVLDYSGDYFEYLGAGHYVALAITNPEVHTIECKDENCILKQTDNVGTPHRWIANADGATCADCKANAAASVTAGGTAAYFCDFATALDNWTEGTTLTLLAHVTDLTGYITTTDKGLVLDLNGHTLASDDTETISIGSASELTIRDSKGGGCIEGTVSASADAYSKSTLRLESGTVKKVMANGDFTMTGGSIKNEDGDGLYSNGGDNNVVISGGEIYGEETGIWLTYGSNLTITGTAKITGANEYAVRNGSGVVISGTPTISGSQCEFSLGGKITLNTQPASGKTWRVKIDTAKIADGVFATPGEGVTLDPEWFTSGMTGYVVVKDSDNLKLAKGITEDMVTVTESATYSGIIQTPAVTVTWTDGVNEEEPEGGFDYTVSYTNSKGVGVSPCDADTYTVTVTGMGSYAGEVTKTYTINPRSLTDAAVTAPNQTYTGSRLTPEVTVALTGYTITSDDYDVSYLPDTLTDAGSYTITVTGKGNFTGETTGAFTIDKASITSAIVTAPAQTYDGMAKEPDPTVTITLEGTAKTLVKDTDYTVTGYGDNTGAGTATINITGIGNFTGTATGAFIINKATPRAADFVFTPPSGLTYDGTSKIATVAARSSVTGMGNDIDISYYQGSTAITGEPVNADDYTARISVAEGDNYLAASGITDSAWTFTIEKADLTITARDQTIEYGESIATGTGQVEVSGLAANETLSEITLTPGIQDAGTGDITPGAAKIDPSADNYKITYKPGTLTINKAAALTLSGEMSVVNKLEHSYTFDLSAIVPGNNVAWGSDPAVKYELDSVNITGGYYDGNNQPASISGHILTLPIQEVDSNTEDSIGSVTVTIESQNYEVSTLEITVNSTNKEPVEITGVTARDGTYNGSAQQGYTGTPTSAFGATGYEITYTGRGSTSYDSATAPTDAGDYTVTFKVPDSNPAYMGARSLDFSIAPGPLSWNTGSVAVSQAYVPDKVDVEDTSPITNTSITLSGVISGDDVNWVGTVESAEFADDDIGENKTVTVTLTGLILTGTDAANYTAPGETFTITGAITEPKTNGSGMLGMLDNDLIVSRDELPTDAGMDEVYGAATAAALRAKFGGTNVMESIQIALKEAAVKAAGANSSSMNHKVLEIFLEYYDDIDQKWVRITEDNLDEVESRIPGGVPVTIPFDLFSSDINSSNYSNYDFLLHHMITLPLDNANVGDIEQLTVTVDASGLHATVENGFSPFVISYAGKPTDSSGEGSSGSSGGSSSTYKDGEYDFWMGVKAQIEAAKDSATLRVSAGDYTRMPIEVMNALRAGSNVTLSITWNGGNDISIPSNLAPTPESDRVYYELSELAAVFPAKAAATPDRETDTATDTEEESPASASPATGDTDGETSEPEGEEITTQEETTEEETTEEETTEEETSEGTAPETEEMIQEETGKEETKEETEEGCIWHWLMLLFMLACVLFIVIGERKPLKTTLIALGVDAALTVIVMIAGSCSLDIPFAIGTLLVAGASIPVKNMIFGKDVEKAEE